MTPEEKAEKYALNALSDSYSSSALSTLRKAFLDGHLVGRAEGRKDGYHAALESYEVESLVSLLKQSLHAKSCNAPFGQAEKFPTVEEFKTALDRLRKALLLGRVEREMGGYSTLESEEVRGLLQTIRDGIDYFGHSSSCHGKSIKHCDCGTRQTFNVPILIQGLAEFEKARGGK